VSATEKVLSLDLIMVIHACSFQHLGLIKDIRVSLLLLKEPSLEENGQTMLLLKPKSEHSKTE